MFLSIALHALWNLVISLSSIFNLFGLDFVYYIIFLVLVGICGIVSIIGLIFLLRKKGIFSKKPKEGTQIRKPIKIELVWFELIGIYFLLIVLLPVLIQKITEYFSFGEGIIILAYFAILLIAGTFIVMEKNNVYHSTLKFNDQKLTSINSVTNNEFTDEKIEEKMP